MRKEFIYDELHLEELECETLDTGRTYTTPEGNKYPSITTCLSILSRDSIAEWRERVGDEEADQISFQAANRGTAVHECIERYLLNKDPCPPTPLIRLNMKELLPHLDRNIGTIYGLEKPLYSDELGVAGRVDIIADWNGIPSIIDIKTSTKEKKREWCHGYFMQETFYAIALEERTGMRIDQLVTLISVDQDTPKTFVECRTDWRSELEETINAYKQERAGR